MHIKKLQKHELFMMEVITLQLAAACFSRAEAWDL
jgi:hypothetical protein